MEKHEDYQRYLQYKRDDLIQVPSDKKFVWFNPDPKDCNAFSSAEVLKEEGNEWMIRTEEGQVILVKSHLISPKNPVQFDGVENLSDLTHLNEPALLHNLRLRYNKDVIYTNSGVFLVAINPYKNIPIYTDAIIALYTGKRRAEVAPHIFVTAEEAYCSMLADKINQSILITGETGSGKTENAKKIIQYLTSVAGRVANSDNQNTLENRISHANLILEAFGNAKTTRNSNSSRFGKFIELQFNGAGFISGAKIQSYLLEKSRVVIQREQERSFHIFYQVLSGASLEERERMSLGLPESYHYLNKSGCFDIEGVNDASNWKDTQHALDVLNFSTEEREGILRVISGILHLGNVVFTESHGGASEIQDQTALNSAASMLNVPPSQLEKALIAPKIHTAHGQISASLTPAKSQSCRDSLAKSIYQRLFLWILKKINVVLAHEERASFIGLLDITGFENCTINSFEQFCSNHMNERLQQLFNQRMFVLEQEEYKKSMLDWTMIDFGVDSQSTIDLIEAKYPPGILSCLEEQCVFPGSTDQTLLSKLNAQFGGERAGSRKHPNFDRLDKPSEFGIRHYAGTVSYNVTNWLEKNMDPLNPSLEDCMRESADEFVRHLFTEHFDGIPVRGKGANFVTVGSQFKSQLSYLMTFLQSTHLHFVHCILPNHQQKPGRLEDACVLDQLRYIGVLEATRLTRLGFPHRMNYSDFVRRYYLLVDLVPRNPADPKYPTVTILKGLNIPESGYRLGLTKIFFRMGQLEYIEELHQNRLKKITIIAAAARGWIERKHFRQELEKISGHLIQDTIRAYPELFDKVRSFLPPNLDNEFKEMHSQFKDLASQLAVEKAARAALEQKLKEAETKIAQLQDLVKLAKQDQDLIANSLYTTTYWT